MRLRAGYLLAVAGCAVVALSFVGSAAAAPDPACGTTLLTSFTLTADINCTGFTDGKLNAALYIGQAGITINLNGHTITGAVDSPVIDNTYGLSQGYDGVTVEGGTMVAQGDGTNPVTAIDNSMGGDGFVVSDMTITGPGAAGTAADSTAIDPTGSTGIAISGNTISGFRNGVVLTETTGALVKGNSFTAFNASYSPNNCAGVAESKGTGDMVVGNTFTSSAGVTPAFECYGLWTQNSAGTVFSGNTATLLDVGVKSHIDAGLMILNNVFGGNYNPNNGNRNGIWLDGFDSGDVISGNYVRNSSFDGIDDDDSFNNSYTGNVLNHNGYEDCIANLYIFGDGNGPVTVVNNYSNNTNCAGVDIVDAYNATVPGGPYTLVSGNTALLNFIGFWLQNDVGATVSNNIAGVLNYGNNWGFVFFTPERNTISNNSATGNGTDGFDFNNVIAPNGPLAVTNNSATYNGVYGFWGEYPVAGSGNIGGGTNGTADCLLVAGCS